MRGDALGVSTSELADFSSVDDDGYEASDALLPYPYQMLQRRMSCWEMVRATVVPWVAFVLNLSLFLLLYHDHEAIVWGLLLFCAALSALALTIGSLGRHPTLLVMGFLCLISIGFGAAIGVWLDRAYMQRFWELYRGAKHRIVNPQDASLEIDKAAILHFTAGTVIDTRRTLGYLAKGSTFCVAPVLSPGQQASAEVLYWAIGKDCCNRRSNFDCGAWEDLHTASGFVEQIDDVFSRAVAQAASLYGIEAASAPRLVSFVEHPAVVLAQIWHETFVIAILAVILDLLVCIIATLTMATASVYASKAKC